MNGALNGIKVVDLSRLIAGPYCGMLLADMGAEVIKVEKLTGEDTRHVPPLVEQDSLYTVALNRNKRAITLDFRHQKSKDVLTRLFKWADIIIENFRPGTLEKMGFKTDQIHEINSSAIIVRCSGFGQTGPLKHRPGFDPIAQAMSGLMNMTGRSEDPPLLSGTSIIDYSTGMHAAIGALSALHHRNRTNRGQVIDVSLYESAVSMLVSAIPNYHLNQSIPKRTGNQDRYSAPANTYQTKDGWIYLNAFNDRLWLKLCKAMQMEDLATDERYENVSLRVQNVNEIDDIIQQWLAEYNREEAAELLDKYGIPCGPVQSVGDLLSDEHLREREQIINVNHPTVGEIPVSGITIKLSDTPGKIRYDPPLIGQHNQEVYLNELGFEEEEFNKLKEDGVI
ncbi:CaiB/BaiF CoA transferase family protein [Oceanobacillus damuensis]|uniref:CaiB/BaiF CoA transferase family protein n=1 Tax=Oceanobacillus damuensis TaxID=937928 RepID=UPI00082EC5CE|nr:CoA transferase [Oceanobacillus damuensis]